MHKPISIYISEPCHEKWNNMTATQQGKFCSSCNKQVTDFSLMTDQQILSFLSRHKENVCGRFYQHQLERNLVQQKITKSKSLWLAFTLPFVVLFQKSFGQTPVLHKQGTVAKTVKEKQVVDEITTGLIAVPIVETTVLHGKLTDEMNNPVRYATIKIRETNQQLVSDSLGMFSFDSKGEDSLTILATSVGYSATEKCIATKDYQGEIQVQMHIQPAILGAVVVAGYTNRRKGNMSISHQITTTEKIDSSIRKALRISAFTVYPNPATKGSIIRIQMKQAGSYELQLLDNKSNLLKTQHADSMTDNATIMFAIPNDISTGIYYVRLLCAGKKQSVKKIMIM